MATPNDVLKMLSDAEVDIVDIRFCDLPGLMQHFSIPAHELSEEATQQTETMANVADPNGLCPHQVWEEEWKANLLEAAIDNVRRKIDPPKYQIFDLYVHKAWSAKRVAATLGISTNQVYVAKNRVTRLIKEEAARLEKNMI